MEENNKVKLARYRALPYIVNWNGKKYQWAGAIGQKVDIKEVPEDLFNFLSMSTSTITNGELVLINRKELLDDFVMDKEELENNIHTKEDIKKILNMTDAKMKKELDKITNTEEKRFILDVAREVNLDSAKKRKIIMDWLGIEGATTDDIFAVE